MVCFAYSSCCQCFFSCCFCLLVVSFTLLPSDSCLMLCSLDSSHLPPLLSCLHCQERYSWSPLRLHSLMTTHIILFLGSPLRCTVMCLGLGGGWWQAPYLQDMQDSQSRCSCWRWRDSACHSSTTSVVQTRQSISDTNLCRRGEAEG